MRINKRTITILIATAVLSVPAVLLRETILPVSAQSNEPRYSVMLAADRAEQEERDKKAAEAAAEAAKIAAEQKAEADRVAAAEAAQAAEAEKQRVAQVEAQKAQEAAAIASNCGPADPAYVYRVLVESGVPRNSAIQQVGSWKTESKLDPCQTHGDGGVAWGLNSWHPGRRADMPTMLKDQIIWAVHTEMKRDCSECYQIFMSPNAGISSIRAAIQKSTRWGVEGDRWQYANEFMNIL